MLEATEQPKESALSPRHLRIIAYSSISFLLAGTLALLVWALRVGIPSVSKPSVGDLVSLLFAASSLALVIFSFLIAFLAIFGWQTLKADVAKEIEASVSSRIVSLEKELRGRAWAALGVIQGRFCEEGMKKVLTQSEKSEMEDSLREVVSLCSLAYQELSTVPGNGKYMALNNFLYFSSMKPADGLSKHLVDQAKELLAVSQKKTYWAGVLTYCRVVVNFCDEPAELKAVDKLLRELKANQSLSLRQQREAASYEAPLLNRLKQLGIQATPAAL